MFFRVSISEDQICSLSRFFNKKKKQPKKKVSEVINNTQSKTSSTVHGVRSTFMIVYDQHDTRKMSRSFE